MIPNLLRILGMTAGTLVASTILAEAQVYAPPPPVGNQNPVCQRLEAQLSTIDRGATDPGRADQTRRYEDAANKQQAELDRTVAQARRMGCEGSGFFLFGGQPAQCGPLNNQIQQMRASLDRILGDLQRLQSAGIDYERDGQRRTVLAALARNDCGPQYRGATQAATQPRGFFDTLFGSGSIFSSGPSGPSQSSTYRTICVRTCDGFYFPISFATTPGYFRDDEQKCQRMCPAAEVMLFSHRNPGEEVTQATSISGRLYTELPNAFRYRQEFNAACSCKRPGDSWADALKHLEDRSTIERGDIVITEERAKAMSQPRDPQGRTLRPALPNTTGKPAALSPKATEAVAPPETAEAPAGESPPATKEGSESGKRSIRSVGPQFYPQR